MSITATSASSERNWSLTEPDSTAPPEAITCRADRSNRPPSERVRSAASVSARGRAVASPMSMVSSTRSPASRASGRLGLEVGAGVEHQGAAVEQGLQGHPHGAAVDQRAQRQPAHDRVAPPHPLHDLVGVLQLGDAAARGAPPAQRGEEDVLVAPHHALGGSGGAAGVEHVAIVGRAARHLGPGSGLRAQPGLVVRADLDHLLQAAWPRRARRPPAGRARVR